MVSFPTKKWLTSHIEREHRYFESKPNMLEKHSNSNKNTRNKNEICSSPQQSRIDNNKNNVNNNSVSAYENHAHVVSGARNVFKQTMRDAENLCRAVGAYDMRFFLNLKRCVVKLGMKNLTISDLI